MEKKTGLQHRVSTSSSPGGSSSSSKVVEGRGGKKKKRRVLVERVPESETEKEKRLLGTKRAE